VGRHQRVGRNESARGVWARGVGWGAGRWLGRGALAGARGVGWGAGRWLGRGALAGARGVGWGAENALYRGGALRLLGARSNALGQPHLRSTTAV
jgi:hypothetical protein